MEDCANLNLESIGNLVWHVRFLSVGFPFCAINCESLGWKFSLSVASSAFKLNTCFNVFEWYNLVHPRFFWFIWFILSNVQVIGILYFDGCV